MATRASYKAAIHWLANNDDNEWLRGAPWSPSVTACLVADLWGKSTDDVARDLLRELQHIHPNSWYGVVWKPAP